MTMNKNAKRKRRKYEDRLDLLGGGSVELDTSVDDTVLKPAASRFWDTPSIRGSGSGEGQCGATEGRELGFGFKKLL